MKIAKKFITDSLKDLIETNEMAATALHEIESAIQDNKTEGSDHFVINSTEKNCNGVVPIKEPIYKKLEEDNDWYREKPLPYLESENKGGPIDVYKEFEDDEKNKLRVGLEFETGNISSAHRSVNKLSIGLENDDLDMAVLMMPTKDLSYYLTDRVSNYEELKPYFPLVKDRPFVIYGFDADEYSEDTPILKKGKDGMSDRAIHKWKNKNSDGAN